jgi:hypothetical protein
VTPWPCTKCGADGVRNIGIEGWCAHHLEELYATFDRSVFAFAGVGLQNGPLRPDWGPHYANLACNACGATWTGVTGEPCGWCRRTHQRVLAHQAELVLTPPDVDRNDQRWEAAMDAWSGRLRVAVDAGIIEDRDAVAAMRREGKRAA